MGFRECEISNIMKVFIFSDTHWALGRIHRDVMKQLNHEVRYTDWATYSLNEFLDNYNWCDKCITNLVAYKSLKPSFSFLDFRKCIFVSHGSVEHEGIELDPNLKYGMVSDCLETIFPSTIKPFLMPNGVDPDNFQYLPKNGELHKLGWCGAPHVQSKQIEWAYDISNQTQLELSIASNLSYEEVKTWYNTIDLLIVTAIPIAYKETGPLPPFEAIVSGVPVIGTPVGNFRHIPGPKFTTVEEAVLLINHYKQYPNELEQLAKEQYEYVMGHWTYKTLAKQWQHALEFS
jgi:glycosyltransferase involved in cell wall biosynthesis